MGTGSTWPGQVAWILNNQPHSHPAGLWGLGTSGPRWRQRLLLWPGRSQDHWALRTRRASQDQPGPRDGREPHLSRPPPGSGTVPTEHSQSPPLAPTPTLLQPRHPAQHPRQAPHVHSKCSLLLYPSAHVSTHTHTHTTYTCVCTLPTQCACTHTRTCTFMSHTHLQARLLASHTRMHKHSHTHPSQLPRGPDAGPWPAPPLFSPPWGPWGSSPAAVCFPVAPPSPVPLPLRLLNTWRPALRPHVPQGAVSFY